MKGWSSDNDTMNSPEYNESCQVMRNTKRVYEDVHPVTQVQLNKIITAIAQDLSSIDFKDPSSHKRVISELRSITHTPSTRDALVQSLIPFPIADR